jgi:serine/threonine protein kinase/tetratricopeptide (TPR) repeat protein
MTPELYQRLKPLYDAALDIPSENRDAFVAEVCKGDSQLEKGLQNLLAAHDTETGTLDNPIFNVHALKSLREQTFADGTVLLGRFRIVRLLGSGGMGEVYEAIDTQLGRIALKTVIGDITASSERLLRFRKEVQLARDVSNPHVCRIHELFLTEGSEGAFVTMEFLNGETLADKIRESGPLPWREVRTVALELCDALHSIHEAEIIHRDLKTRNIMLASRGGGITTVLMDFGIARRLSHQSGDTSTGITIDGTIVGTPDYMAPEQFEGKEPTPATDVYALGVVLYEIATGKRPVRDDPNKARNGKAKPLTRPSSLQPGIPRRFDEVVCKCLEYDPKRRYQSAKEVERAIRLPSIILRIQQSPLRAAAGMIGFVILLSSLLLVPAIGERVRGILFSSPEKHIAILPLDLVGGNPETQALGDGLMDSLAGKLSNLDPTNKTLFVVPASEVRSRKVNDPASALREFGATIVVKGAFERNGEATRLRLTLIDPKKTRDIGFLDVENQTGDLAVLQDEAVTRMGRLMNISVKDNLMRDGDTVPHAAYEDYLVALGLIQRFDKPGNLDLAISALKNAVKTDPRFALGFARLAQVYIQKYELDSNPKWLQQAEPYCKQAQAIDGQLPLTFVALGRIHEHTGNHDLAVEEFQRALDLDPRNAEALAGIAMSYQNAGRIPEAEAAFLKSAALRPDDWSGYNALGNFYGVIGRQKEAIKQFRKAIGLTPDNYAPYLNLGNALLNSGDMNALPEAEQAFEKSIAISPSYAAYSGLGFLFLIQHHFRDSVVACEKAALLNDQSYDVWNNLSLAYEWVGDVENAKRARIRAIELLQRAVGLNPQDAEAEATLAALLAKNGMKAKALEGITLSLTLSPHDGYVLSEAADTYELLGNRMLAITCLRLALKYGVPLDQFKADPEVQGVLSDPAFQKTAGSQT